MKKIIYIIIIFFSYLSFAQERIVFGVVLDSINNPIEGANVTIEGTLSSTKTDKKGEFSIKAKINDFIIFSFTGMETQRIIGGHSKMRIKLQDINFKYKDGPQTKIKTRSYGYNRSYGYVISKNESPKYNFKYNSVNNNYIIYTSENKKLDSLDIEFQKKYNIIYSPIEYFSNKYYKKHNKLTFNFLNKMYNTTWQNEIRKDAVDIDNFIK
jgi:CarboxypepD_reg-like domain